MDATPPAITKKFTATLNHTRDPPCTTTVEDQKVIGQGHKVT